MHVCGHISSYTETSLWCYRGTKRTWKYFYCSAKEPLAIWKLPPSGATEFMMLPHLSLTFFHPSFTSPPAMAARSANPPCPVITSYNSFLGKGQGRAWNRSTLPKGAPSLKVNTTSRPQLRIGATAYKMPLSLQEHRVWLYKSLGQPPAPRESIRSASYCQGKVCCLIFAPRLL